MSGPICSLAAAIATFALMATIIGFFNGWPAHETVGALVVFLAAACTALLADRASKVRR